MPSKMCHCGKPLHYSDKNLQRVVENLIMELGEYTTVMVIGTGRKFLVPRHYIALHGIVGSELLKMGFEEIPSR